MAREQEEMETEILQMVERIFHLFAKATGLANAATNMEELKTKLVPLMVEYRDNTKALSETYQEHHERLLHLESRLDGQQNRLELLTAELKATKTEKAELEVRVSTIEDVVAKTVLEVADIEQRLDHLCNQVYHGGNE